MRSNSDPNSANQPIPLSTEELVQRAVAKAPCCDSDSDSDPDPDQEHEYWRLIARLQSRLPQILDRMEQLSQSSDEREGEVAEDVLGQSRIEEKAE